jgi:alpha-L-rhamnosidase
MYTAGLHPRLDSLPLAALYWGTGRTDLIIEHRQKINEAFDYFEEQSAKTGLLPYDPRYWLFLDWAETFKDGIPTLYNLEYLDTLENATNLFEAAGLKEDSLRSATKAAALRKIIDDQLWDASTDEPLDGLSWDGERIRRRSLHCIVRSILLGLRVEQHERWATELLLPFVRGPRPRGAAICAEAEASANKTALTPYFMHFNFLALTQLGHDEAVLNCIESWWGDMLDRGLKTTEEVWDAVPGIESLCHAWTAHPLQHISNLLLGIRQTAPGWRKVIFRPIFCGDSARGEVATPQGPIRSAWQREGIALTCKLEIPKGVAAEVQLMGQSKQVIGPFSGTFSLLS